MPRAVKKKNDKKKKSSVARLEKAYEQQGVSKQRAEVQARATANKVHHLE